MSVLTNSALLPFRQHSNDEVFQLWSADFTGQAGLLVSIQPSNQDPSTSAGNLTTAAPLQSFTNVGNYAFNNPRKVRPAASDDNKFTVVGVTLYTVATHDENGIPLRAQPYNQTLERGFVQTGFTVPILTRGLVTIKQSQVNGTALPGYMAIAGANGTITPVNPTAANTNLYVPSGLDIGKFVSSSGAGFGGYYQLMIKL